MKLKVWSHYANHVFSEFNEGNRLTSLYKKFVKLNKLVESKAPKDWDIETNIVGIVYNAFHRQFA